MVAGHRLTADLGLMTAGSSMPDDFPGVSTDGIGAVSMLAPGIWGAAAWHWSPQTSTGLLRKAPPDRSVERLPGEPPRLTDELHEPPPFSHCLDRSPAVPIVSVALAPRGSCPRCSAVHATTALACHRMGSARTAAPRLGATLRCRWRVDFPRLHGFVVHLRLLPPSLLS